MDNIALEVNNVHVKYKKNLDSTIIKNKKNKWFEALKGVSFKVNKGEIYGIIGRNGSGKTTLLRTIAGIFAPNIGEVVVDKNKISLLSLGLGFNNDLSGRKNIYLTGLLTGFDFKYIAEKEEEIIDFSELNEFIDMPVKNYSSGMYSKLAFAIASVLNTDILLIDEVFSVGDEYFKKKSYKKMMELISDKEKTVIMVSHSVERLVHICNKIIWLDNGLVMDIDTPNVVIPKYLSFMNEEGKIVNE